MRLFVSHTSPYARICRILLREHGLTQAVKEIEVDPFADDAFKGVANPLGKIPALVLDNGETLYDSRVIVSFIDATTEGAPLLAPVGTDRRFRDLVDQALAMGLLDAAVASRLESLRPENQQSPYWRERWAAVMLRSADEIAARQIGVDDRELTIGQIAGAAALLYLDFRHPGLGWRSGRAQLADWVEAIAMRESFTATRPPATV